MLELFFCFYFVPSVFEPAENRGPVMACFLLFISCPVDERALRHPNGGAVVARLVWLTDVPQTPQLPKSRPAFISKSRLPKPFGCFGAGVLNSDEHDHGMLREAEL